MMKKLVLLLTALTLLTGTAWADSFVQLLPNGKQQFLDANGDPVSGGTVSFYVPNTLTLKDTWQDPGQTTLNSNPVVLDSAGEATIWGLGAYREIVKDQFGNTLWDSETSGNYGTFQITGGSIDGTTIGATTPASGVFTTLETGALTIDGKTLDSLVDTTSALEQLNVSGLTAGTTVIKIGYYTVGDMPAVSYYLMTSACDLNSGAGDGGAEIASNTANNCWHISSQTAWDPRWWGAKADTVTLASTVTTVSGSGAVFVNSGTFTSADVGKLITITDVIGGTTPSAATYQGTITAVTSGTDITVSPTVEFSTTLVQNIAYGTDDATILNTYATYLKTITPYAGAYLDANFGGASYGLSGPLNMLSGINYNHGQLVALSTSGFSCANGLANVTQANVLLDKFVLNSNYLPVNGYLATTNGNTQLHDSIIYNWLGSCDNQTVTATAASGKYVLTVPSVTGLSNFMVSRNNAGITDRAQIVDVESSTTNSVCNGSLCVVLNKPTTAALSNQSVTFYQDSNGFVSSGAGSGVHLFNDQIQEWNPNDTAHNTLNGDHYGCAFLHQGTQTDVIRTIFDEGVSSVCLDGTTNGIEFVKVEIFPGYDSSEVNPAAILIANGANQIQLDMPIIGGVIQDFLLTTNVLDFSLTNLTSNFVNASPNNIVQVFSDQLNTSLANFVLGAPGVLKSSNDYVSFGGFGTCGTDYSYTGFSCSQMTALAGQKSSVLFSGRGMFLSSANLLGGVLSNAMINNVTHNTATTLDPTSECYSVWTVQNGSTTPTMTLPNNAPVGCSASFYVNGTGVVSLAPASGALLNGGTSSINVTRYVIEQCIVGKDPDGVTAEWSCH